MSEQSTPISPAGQAARGSTQPAAEENTPGKSRGELQAEIDRLNEEVLKLRDLLIGKDAELGVAKGKVAMYEDGRERLENVKGRFGNVPGVGMLLHLFLRLVGRG